MKPVGILALVIIAIGFAIVLSARAIVRKNDLVNKQKCEHAAEMSEDEVEEYKFNKAMLSVKMIGLAITIPGIILLLLFFK